MASEVTRAKPAAKAAAKSVSRNADTRSKPLSIADQSAAIIANAAKGAALGRTERTAAEDYQAGLVSGNTALASQFGGTTSPKGQITLPTNGPVIPNTTTTPVVPPVVPPTDTTGHTLTSAEIANMDANTIFTQGLAEWGLSDLGPMVSALTAKGLNPSAIADSIRKTPSYAARFPAMAGMNASGNSISESEYLAKEATDRQMLYTYLGPNAKAYDNPAQLGTLLTNFVSPVELQSRLQAVHDEVNSSPDTKAWLKSTYGTSDQDLAAAWLDPKLTADQVAKRDSASQIGGAGLTSGFGNLTQAQAELLASQGVTQNQAQNTFAKIGAYGQLEQNLPGNDSGSLTQQQLIDGAFNGGAAGAKIAQEQALRLGQFQDGGGMAANSGGVEGLKNANTL